MRDRNISSARAASQLRWLWSPMFARKCSGNSEPNAETKDTNALHILQTPDAIISQVLCRVYQA